jgi:hypothetical protein
VARVAKSCTRHQCQQDTAVTAPRKQRPQACLAPHGGQVPITVLIGNLVQLRQVPLGYRK